MIRCSYDLICKVAHFWLRKGVAHFWLRKGVARKGLGSLKMKWGKSTGSKPIYYSKGFIIVQIFSWHFKAQLISNIGLDIAK